MMFKSIAWALILGALIYACGSTGGTLQSRPAGDLESRRIRRIAVLPPSMAAGAAPAAARFNAAQVARFTHAALVALPIWQIISESEVREATVNLPPSSAEERLKRIGERVYADAVMMSRVQRYRERVGDEWGAKSPASVAFILDLVDVRRGDIIWTARFDETQKSLSESIFSIGSIGERGLRWLSADQLAQEGVKKAVEQLHAILTRRPAS